VVQEKGKVYYGVRGMLKTIIPYKGTLAKARKVFKNQFKYYLLASYNLAFALHPIK